MNLTLGRGRPRPVQVLIGGAPRSGPTVRPTSKHGGVLVETSPGPRGGLTFATLHRWIEQVEAAGVPPTTVVSADTTARDWAPDELASAPIVTVGALLGAGYETFTNAAGLTLRDLSRFMAAARLLPRWSADLYVLVDTRRVDPSYALPAPGVVERTELRRARTVSVPTPGAFRG